MTQVLGDVLRRTGILGLAIAFALGLAAFDVVRSFVFAGPMVLIGKADDDFTITIRHMSFQYHNVLGALLSLVIAAAALALVWRLRARDTVPCPDCLSEIPTQATVCRYCTSEVRPSG